MLASAACSLSLLAASASAQTPGVTFTTLHSFTKQDVNDDNVDGRDPLGDLVLAGDGNYYGTTSGGGANNQGVVYRMTPDGEFTTLYNFSATSIYLENADGADPIDGLVVGGDGNLYGLTLSGGANSYGTIYRITLAGVLTTLHSFNGGDVNGHNSDGLDISGDLLLGRDGNLYGAAESSGPYATGTIFQVTPAGVLTTLYAFSNYDIHSHNADGISPVGSLVQGSDGNFYGVAASGGTSGFGTVFQVTPAGVLTTLHSFSTLNVHSDNSDGAGPLGGLVQGGDGNFYGTTVYGGTSGVGVVFKITPTGTLTTLHSFSAEDVNDESSDGDSPRCGLVLGDDGNLYGTAVRGGANTEGTLFQITPDGQFTTLHSFGRVDINGYNDDGAIPYSLRLTRGSHGTFYGTTGNGGASGQGTIFKLTVPSAGPSFFTGEEALGSGVYYLAFADGNAFGYYSYLTEPGYVYHFDLGYEYVFDAVDGKSGVYLYDFKSSDFFYTSPTFPFPYLYDFELNTVLYYYPDPGNPGHYNTDGYRFFYRFDTGQIIVK